MTAVLTPQPIYLDVNGEHAYAVFHRPDTSVARDTAVLFCPPFGWEDVCSHRVLRAWAMQLASAGYPVLRITFPSTGDSGGEVRDPARVAAWTTSVGTGASWLRSATGGCSVVGLGVGLGGLIAYRSAAVDGSLDGLVMWPGSGQGRDFMRQWRVFSRLERANFYEGLPSPPALAEGELEAGGFLLSQETASDLAGIDVSRLELTTPLKLGALLLERDGIAVDERLTETLHRDGVACSVASGDGYAEMTSHPQQSQLPEDVVAKVRAWLDAGSSTLERVVAPPEAPPAGAVNRANFEVDGSRWSETPVAVQQDFGELSGILTEPQTPVAGICAVFLNAGAARRIGPNRMWVEAARRWAARGVPSLRLDVEGIGESDGPVNPYRQDGSLYVPPLVDQVKAAVAFLRTRGVAERFILIGLCGGAYWAFHAALDDPDATAAVLMNPRALIWDEGLAPARDLRRLLTERSWARLRKNATPKRVRALLLWLLKLPLRRSAGALTRTGAATTEERVDDALERLRRSETRVTMVFSGREPLLDDLTRSGRLARLEAWPNVAISRIAVNDHTLRPNWAQKRAHAILDEALDQEIGTSGAAPSVGPAGQLRQPVTQDS